MGLVKMAATDVARPPVAMSKPTLVFLAELGDRVSACMRQCTHRDKKP